MENRPQVIVTVALIGVIAIGLIGAMMRCGKQATPVTGTPGAPGVIVTVRPTGAVVGPATLVATLEPGTPPATPATGDDIPMVRIPAGEFIMGSTGEEIVHWERMRCIGSHCGYTDYLSDEWPQMVVYLDEFEIDQVEVTYARYERCVEAGVCSPPREPAPSPDHPVLVAWADADAYCRWVGKRLPTEAEWEKAARGTDGRIYPWGNEWDPARLKIHWVKGEGFTTAPVGSYPQGASPYGALDMAGNAPEWVSDRYDAYPGGQLIETAYFTLTTIQRGGYFNGLGTAQPPEMIYRAADRFPAGYDWRSGFRCVRGPEPPLLEEAVVSATISVQPSPLTEVDLTTMVEIPAGEFQMGNASSDSFPPQTVYLDTFYIDRYETTNAEYVEFLNALGETYFACGGITCTDIDYRAGHDYPSHILKVDGRFVVEAGYENYPVTAVTWEGADAYCRWRGKRLPTDFEWEKAARGTSGLVFPWGDKWDPTKYARKLSPVGSYPEDVSPYGVWDVVGNVQEWISGWYDPDYYQNLPPRNPTGPEKPAAPYRDRRIARSGMDVGLYARVVDPNTSVIWKGVRCAYGP